jgi:hypothetical protein
VPEAFPSFPNRRERDCYTLIGAAPLHSPTELRPLPAVEPLEGKAPDALWAAVTLAAHYPLAPLASAYRDLYPLDDPEATMTYAARCDADTVWEPDPCDDTGALRPDDCE